MKNIKYKTMTEKEFEQIKLLQTAGLTRKQIMEVTGRSHATIDRVMPTKDWAEYKTVVLPKLKVQRAEYAVAHQTKVHDAGSIDMTPAPVQLSLNEKEILEKLDTILSKLDKIDEHIQWNNSIRPHKPMKSFWIGNNK